MPEILILVNEEDNIIGTEEETKSAHRWIASSRIFSNDF